MKERIKGAFTKKKLLHFLKVAVIVAVTTIILLSLLGTVAHATGLVDDTVNADNLYSKYPLSNYQLDFYVDNSWGWLPWNWLDGIGKSVQYGLYCITNFIWTISLYLSNATGYVVQQAYKLDFINDMADSIGQSIQTLAGVNEHGFTSTGFYVGSLLLIILVVGIYVAYTGLIKRETSKALHAVINFVVVFLLSASFIAYAPDYIKKVNDFSSDISTASLDLGTKIMLPDSDSKGKDSVDLIRDSLFSIQVQQPWLLLQFGNSDIEEIGADRVEALVSASPDDEDGKTRENVVKQEIEEKDNNNLTIPQVINRLGMVFFLLIFNLGITIFIFLLTGMMIFSQILFIIFAMFLPISFLLSMIPSYENMAKQAVVRVFNTIMTRAGITLIVTVAFSISSMFYNISSDYAELVNQYITLAHFDDETVQAIMNEALKYQGWKYVYGGSNPNTSFDCSGLTQWCFAKAGISLPRTAQEQYDATQHIPLSEAKAGDLVFFHSTYNAGSYVTHVGIYVGNNQMYHAGDPIGYADLNNNYWQQHLIGAGRIRQ